MRERDFETKYLRLNGHRVKAIVPRKSMTLEEAVKKSREILRKHK